MARAKRTDNKGRVLRTGEQQRSEDDRYLYRYTDLRGRKKTVYANTLVELREKEEEIQRDLADGIETSNLTLNELFEIYMESKKNIRETTRNNYLSRWRSVYEQTIGGMKIAKIKQLHIISLISDMAEDAAEGTIRVNLNLLSSVMEMAVESDMIRKNPCKGCGKYISGTKKERKALTRAEQTIFVDFVNSESRYAVYSPLLTFMLSTGLRVGEVTGLTWSNVDLKENVIHIRQQMIYSDFGDGYRLHIQALKTEAGCRDIPLTEEARRSLFKQKELSFMLGSEAARQQNVDGVSDFVFSNKEGRPLSTSALNQELYRMVDYYNESHEEKLPHISAHILRHTFCSRMAEAGIDVKTLQYIMGHSDIGVTMNTYTHLDFSQIQENVGEIESKILVG